jgi:hypothetical protein
VYLGVPYAFNKIGLLLIKNKYKDLNFEDWLYYDFFTLIPTWTEYIDSKF